MKNTPKFKLVFDGCSVQTLEELQDHFTIGDILFYHRCGLLWRWLADRDLTEAAAAVAALDPNDSDEDITPGLARAVGVPLKVAGSADAVMPTCGQRQYPGLFWNGDPRLTGMGPASSGSSAESGSWTSSGSWLPSSGSWTTSGSWITSGSWTTSGSAVTSGSGLTSGSWGSFGSWSSFGSWAAGAFAADPSLWIGPEGYGVQLV